ncbi:hypothetical protein LTR37_003567 [Vermiconidia calcicola]|uniref:Uncharacterized protein n=1 Tax=Vermiconidia calcicola TaxID=1690605 RepID=A0ACC3NRJ0_9PEZI|nr:hypothetical protein LTR37_003567 [Vermiconidia calcicola]
MESVDTYSIAQTIIRRYREEQLENKRSDSNSIRSQPSHHPGDLFPSRRQEVIGTQDSKKRSKRPARLLEKFNPNGTVDSDSEGDSLSLQDRNQSRELGQLPQHRRSHGESSETSDDPVARSKSPRTKPSDSREADFLSMAVPSEVTIHNLTGSYTINNALSDSSQQVLKMQKVGFLVRQAVAYSTVTVTIQQYTDSDGKPHLDQDQLSTGGMKNFEDRIMDWVWTEKSNWIWGKVRGRGHYTKLAEIDDPYLREGWTEECANGDVVEGVAESVTDSWSARQVWGFAMIDGQRRHVRKIHATRPGWKDLRIRMVYDWKAPANAMT